MEWIESETVIELEHIYFGYDGGAEVLGDLQFVLRRGEHASLMGANGCGKTTLFHIIMGLLIPNRGIVRVFQKSRIDEKDFYEVRTRIGLLFQDSDDQLFSPTVAEDIAFGPLNLRKKRDEVRMIVHNTLDLLGLQGYEDKITYKLSGGEKRLVALATVLAMQPEVLLLDEPVLGLDEMHTERFVRFLKQFNGSYIIISHEKDFLTEVTDTAYTITNGRTQQVK